MRPQITGQEMCPEPPSRGDPDLPHPLPASPATKH